MEHAHQNVLYKPNKLNMTCFKFITAIAVIHGAEPSKHMFLQCLQKHFHFCDEGTSHFCFRQHCREPMSLFFLSSFISFCPNWALLCPRHLYYIADKNISSYPHPDEPSSKPKCPNETNIINQQFCWWLFVNFTRK